MEGVLMERVENGYGSDQIQVLEGQIGRAHV